MSYGPPQIFTVVCASGVTAGTFSLPKSYSQVYLVVPTMTSGTDIGVRASGDGTTYYRMIHPLPVTASVQSVLFNIASSITQKVVPIPQAGTYGQIELTTAMTATPVTFYLLCVD